MLLYGISKGRAAVVARVRYSVGTHTSQYALDSAFESKPGDLKFETSGYEIFKKMYNEGYEPQASMLKLDQITDRLS